MRTHSSTRLRRTRLHRRASLRCGSSGAPTALSALFRGFPVLTDWAKIVSRLRRWLASLTERFLPRTQPEANSLAKLTAQVDCVNKAGPLGGGNSRTWDSRNLSGICDRLIT